MNLEITNLAKELGIGPSIFLITVKKLIFLFSILTFINIPVFCFLYGTDSSKKSSM